MTTNTRTLQDLINQSPWLLTQRLDIVEAVLKGEHRDREDGLSPSMTLTEFYWKWYRPMVSEADGRDAKTIREREIALEYWKSATGDPPLEEINKSTTTQFVNFLRTSKFKRGKLGRERTLSPATIRKHVLAISSVLNIAGPRTHKFRDAVELIGIPPRFPTVQVYTDVTMKTPTLRHLAALLRACKVATQPRLPGCRPETWWRSIYIVLYNTGLRKSDVMNARWKDFQCDGESYRLHISSATEKKHREKVIPLTAAAVDAILAMPEGGPEDLIFPWPLCSNALHDQRIKIGKAAGLPSVLASFHAIRRLVGSTVSDAQKVLGHTCASTTRNHYQNLDVVRRALEGLPKPEE